MGTPRAFLDKLKRRGVYRVAGAYVVVGLGVLGAAELILDPLGFGALRPYVVILVLVGLPIAVVLAWAYRLTPETAEDGPPLTPSDAADDAESDNLHPKSRRIDGVRKGIAVLPFVNMSSDPEQEYFSDGISEELLNLLTTVPDLRVVSRSSAFYFKGKDVRATDVARQLNVQHLLEGSVRKAENRVRITAQLIDASTDSHLWSQAFDRSLDDIFAIQDEIAAAVLDQLKVTLLDSARTRQEIDPGSYALFLQARHYELVFLRWVFSGVADDPCWLSILERNRWLPEQLDAIEFDIPQERN